MEQILTEAEEYVAELVWERKSLSSGEPGAVMRSAAGLEKIHHLYDFEASGKKRRPPQ